MYWTDWGTIPRIEEASLDGTNRRSLVNTLIARPMGITIDYDEDKLYFLDDAHDTINVIDIGTGNSYDFPIKSLVKGTGQGVTPFGIAVWDVCISTRALS